MAPLGVVTVDVAQQRQQLREGDGIDAVRVVPQAVLGPLLQLVEAPAALGDADDGDLQLLVGHHPLEGREDLLVGQVAGGAEEHQRVGDGVGLPCRLLVVAAELEAHGRQHAVGEVGLAPRAEALVERRGEHGRGHRLVDGGDGRPPPLTRVGHPAREVVEPRADEQGVGGEVEQPRRDDAPPPPQLGDLLEVELVLVELGVAQRRRLGVDRVVLEADVGVAQHVQALGVGRHDPVLDAVVDHLHEVAGAARAAVEPPLLGRRRRAAPFPPLGARRRLPTPGASTSSTGCSRATAVSSPPTIRQ